MNLPDNMTIVPHQTVTKYFAVPSINLDNPELTVKCISGDKVFDFTYTITKEQIKKTFKFQEYVLKGWASGGFSYVVVKQGRRIFSLKGNKFYIISDQKSEPFNIYSAYYDSFSNNYGKIVNIKQSPKVSKSLDIPMSSFETIKKHPNTD